MEEPQGIRVAGCRLQVAGCRLQVAGYESWRTVMIQVVRFRG